MLRHVRVQPSTTELTFHSLDGLRLSGTVVAPPGALVGAAVLVHGGGVTREEGGFFTRLALGLAAAGVASLRFDFRAHGASEGRPEDVTLAGIVNDIRAAVGQLQLAVGNDAPVSLIGASFGGGVAGYFAARYPKRVRRLVLLNPLLNYKKRFIDDKPYWHDNHIDGEAGAELAAHGALSHSPTFKLGRALLNEVFYLQPHTVLGNIEAPTLFVHGTRDTFIPVESSRWGVEQIKTDAKLIEIDGAQHGIAVHDDPQYLDPQTQAWQAQVVEAVAAWLSQ
jgi:alpha-beta hydrolase superfamily lysophospholipase